MTYIGLSDGNLLVFAKMAVEGSVRSVQLLHSPVVSCTRQIRPFLAAFVAAIDEVDFQFSHVVARGVSLDVAPGNPCAARTSQGHVVAPRLSLDMSLFF